MSFADPQTVTIDATTYSLPRVESLGSESTYTDSSGLVSLSASSAKGKRYRRVIRLDHTKIAADVFAPDTNVQRSMSVYMVFDTPLFGYTLTEAFEVYAGFINQVTATSDLLVHKLLGGEH